MAKISDIPQELRDRPQWVLWREEERGGRTTKVPYAPGVHKASSTDLATWNTFEDVLTVAKTGQYDGIGFVFSSADPFVGVDLDDCIQHGGIEPWAVTIVEALCTYTEVSPSGTGVHCIARGKLPVGGGQTAMPDGGKLELYSRERYLTFTGDVLDKNHGTVEDRPDEITALYRKHFGSRTNGRANGAGTGEHAGGPGNGLDDAEIIERARASKYGEEFSALWNGDTSAHDGDWSRADYALCSHLAFWTGGDADRMDRLFRDSGLMREKWDEQRGAETYGERTVRKALEGQTNFYKPPVNGRSHSSRHRRNGAPHRDEENPPSRRTSSENAGKNYSSHLSHPLRDRDRCDDDETNEDPADGYSPEEDPWRTRDRQFFRGGTATYEPEATPLFGFEKPAPLRWKVAGLIPEGHVSMLAADGGTGKSFLAVYLSLRICTGKPFFGLATRRGRVLYVDYELDAEEQQRRVWRVVEGMNLTVSDDALGDRFFYYRPTAPLGTTAAHREVLKLIERHDIDFVVLDSLTVGSTGDVQDQADVVPIMQRLREWGTVFALDHVTHDGARGNASKAHPFGSRFKRHMARSTFNMAKADGGGYLLKPDKSNFTAKQDLVCYAVDFDGDGGPVRFSKVDSTDGRMAGSLSNMSSYDVTLTAIKEMHEGDPVTPEQVVTWRDEHDVDPIKKGTVKNHFTVLNQRGKITLDGSNAVPIGEDYHTPETHHGDAKMGTTNRDEKNPPDAPQTAKNGSSSRSSHRHTSYRNRDTVTSDGSPTPAEQSATIHELHPNGSGGDGADWLRPGIEAQHKLTGRSVEVIDPRGRAVIIEYVDTGERVTVGRGDLEPT